MADETVNHTGVVLTHPAFNRPAVENQRSPGPKKGTLSIASARRRRGAQAARQPHEEAVNGAALAVLEARLRAPGAVLDSPQAVRRLLRMRLAEMGREGFGVLFIDQRHAVIALEVMFVGTLAQTSVHAREIVKRALALNAASVVLAHNLASGGVEPSGADRSLTYALRAALRVVDVFVLDHIIFGRCSELSFAELGLI